MKEKFTVYFITDGDISVIYFGQDVSKNFGAECPQIKQKEKYLKKCTFITDSIEKKDYGTFWNGYYVDTNLKQQFLLEYIEKAKEWAKTHDEIN